LCGGAGGSSGLYGWKGENYGGQLEEREFFQITRRDETMTKQEVFEFMRANPVCGLATAKDNRPFVRMIALFRADENGIIFATGENKDMHWQMKGNPQVELCFYNTEQGKQVRVSGTAEVVEDLELKKQVVKDYPFLQEWVDREGYEVLVVYKVEDAVATPWTMETNFKPKEYIEL
jgi:uncharacterized pyridoxamine 5'-phosphate oxidase family protein